MLLCDVCGRTHPDSDEDDNATAICECGRMKCRMEYEPLGMTIPEALAKLPSPYHRQALDERKRQKLPIENDDTMRYENISDALMSAFVWLDTKQPDFYWSRLNRYLRSRNL